MKFRDLKLRVRALVMPRRVERELSDELAFHIERETKRLIDGGLPADEARRQATIRFGSMTVAADDCRDERGTTLIETTVRDVLYAFRTFARAPLSSFTIVATMSAACS